MELLAVIVGLETLKKRGNTVSIYSDSKYVVDPINKKWLDQWQKKSWSKVKNVDLWKRLLISLRDQKVTFFLFNLPHHHPERRKESPQTNPLNRARQLRCVRNVFSIFRPLLSSTSKVITERPKYTLAGPAGALQARCICGSNSSGTAHAHSVSPPAMGHEIMYS